MDPQNYEREFIVSVLAALLFVGSMVAFAAFILGVIAISA